MSGPDDPTQTMLRNRLLGRWAAEKLGMTGAEAEAYSQALAAAAADPARSDVFGTIRRDFDAAGVVQSDEQILAVMTDLTIQAGNRLSAMRTGLAAGAAIALKRRLTSP